MILLLNILNDLKCLKAAFADPPLLGIFCREENSDERKTPLNPIEIRPAQVPHTCGQFWRELFPVLYALLLGMERKEHARRLY